MTTTATAPTRASRLRILRSEAAETAKHLRQWLAGPCLPGCFSPYLQALSDRYERQQAEMRATPGRSRGGNPMSEKLAYSIAEAAETLSLSEWMLREMCCRCSEK